MSDLNRELGTNYKFQFESGQKASDLVDFYTTMSIEEFESYIRNAYKADVTAKKASPYITTKVIDLGGTKAGTRRTIQEFHYYGSSHYLGFETDIYSSGSTWYYEQYIKNRLYRRK